MKVIHFITCFSVLVRKYMRDKPKTTPRTQRFLSKRRSTIIAWLSWEDSDDSDHQKRQPSTANQFPD